MRICALALASLPIAACGLSLTGTAQPDATDASFADEGSVSATDGALAADAASDLGTSDVAEAAPAFDTGFVCTAPPGGWTRAAYLGDRSMTCPAGAASLDAVEHPTAAAGACSCGSCAITVHQSCSSGDVPTFYDSTPSPTCGSGGATVRNAPAGACVNLGPFTLGRHFRGTPPPPTGPSQCTIVAVGARGMVATTPVRVCTPAIPNDCSLNNLGDCIASPGDVACPVDSPYQIKHLVGSDFTLTCGNGTCTCDLTTTCKGTLAVSGQSDCGNSFSLDVDDKCNGANQLSYQYTRYTGVIANESCAAGAAPAPSVELTGPQTLCCR
jgi:hypothetical protein